MPSGPRGGGAGRSGALRAGAARLPGTKRFGAPGLMHSPGPSSERLPGDRVSPHCTDAPPERIKGRGRDGRAKLFHS